MTIYNCTDCERLIRPGDLFGHGLDNVCARCYAIRVQHPSARKLVKQMKRVDKTEELTSKLAEILERDLSKMEEAIIDWVVVQFQIEESLKLVKESN